MQWRPLIRVFLHSISTPTFTVRRQPEWQPTLTPARRAFHSLDGKSTLTSNPSEVQPDWSEEADAAMAQQELVKLQQLLGLVESNKFVKDVVFVCIDCEAYEHDQTKITEIGMVAFLSAILLEARPTLIPHRCIGPRLPRSQRRRPWGGWQAVVRNDEAHPPTAY